MRSSRGRRATVILLLTMLGSLGLVAVPVSAATVLCSGVTKADTAKCDPGWAEDMNTSYWGMYKGHNCTNYVAWRLIQDGVQRPKVHLGNAVTWAANAKKSGVRVDSTPAVGSAGTWPGKNHVVYVEEVGNGYLILTEDNYPGYYPKGMYRKLKVWKGESGYPKQFIHFEDGADQYRTPNGLKATTKTDTSVTLAWDAVGDAPRYRVQYAPNADMSGAKYLPSWENGITVKNLEPNTQYWFRVVVVDALDDAKLSEYTGQPYPSTSTWTLPIPSGLRATSQSGSTLSLAWNAVSGAPRYRIQYAPSSTMSGARYTSFTGTTGTLTGLDPETRYWFRVTAVDSADQTRLSDYTQDPWPSTGTTDGTLPVPTGLTSTAQTDDSISLSWDAVPGAPRYRIQYAPSSTMAGAKYQSFTGTSATLTGLTPGTQYWFRVVAVDSADVEKLGDYTQQPWPSTSTFTLPIPSGLTATGRADDKVHLAWNAVAGATRYRVQYSTDRTMKGAQYATFDGTSGSLTGLQPSTQYWYRVVAIATSDGSKLSDYTAEPWPSTTTRDAGPWVPEGLKATTASATSMTLAWDAVDGAPRYRIQYAPSSSMQGAKYVNTADSTVTLTGLTAGTRYWFRVAVVDAKNQAKLTDYTQDPWPSAMTQDAMKIPTGLTSTATTKNSLTLSWNAVSGAPRYRVQYAPSSTMKGAKYLNTTGTTMTLPSLSANTRYWFRVVVVDANNQAKLTDYTQNPWPSAVTAKK